MDSVLDGLQLIIYLLVIGIVGKYFINRWHREKPQREHLATKARLKEVGVLEPEDQVSPREAAQRNLRFLGLPSVDAGSHIVRVPCFNPEQAGHWQDNREVISTARVIAYTKQGTDPLEMIELTDGYLLVACSGKSFIFKSYSLTGREESELEKQRQDAVDRADGVIESFAGHKWKVSGAYGQNIAPKSGERECSYIQVLSVHPRLGEGDLVSTLPPNVLDGQEHDYYDLRARNFDSEDILYFFYTASKWSCYIGRILAEDESSQMQGV